MKRRVALFVVCILTALVFVTACAETYDREILFRDLEWGCSYNDALSGYSLKSTSSGYGEYSIYYWMFNEDGSAGKYDTKVSFGIYIDPTFGKVAGYDLMEAGMRFAYTPDEDGCLSTDVENGRLIMGSYRIKVTGQESQEKAWNDLTGKLARLYGEGYEEIDSHDRFRVWRGAQGTMVSLVKEINHWDTTYYISIRYSYDGGEDLLQAAQEASDYEFSQMTEGL